MHAVYPDHLYRDLQVSFRVLFSVIDTPGLDFANGRELKLERQVNGILKYVDT